MNGMSKQKQNNQQTNLLIDDGTTENSNLKNR